MALVPFSLLFRVAHPCRYVKNMPHEKRDELFDLPESCRLDNFNGLDTERENFADVRIAWNELGLGLQVEIAGKTKDLVGDAAKPHLSDGVTFWIDTRDARTSHRASRYCHQFHLLPTGGGPDHDEPALVQTKIHRALQDAPLLTTGGAPFRRRHTRGGYVLQVFLTAAALTGFDPEQNRRLGIHYAVRDSELGVQALSLGADFPYAEDPSLWSVLELTDEGPAK